MTEEMCHCGRPLHYTDPENRRKVERLIAELGSNTEVTVGGRTFVVPRHYIALHGLRGYEVPFLGFQEKTGAGDRD